MLLLGLLAIAGCKRRERTIAPTPEAAAARRVCTIPDAPVVTSEIVIEARCDVEISTKRTIAPGGRLAIYEGARVRFGPDALLVIEGGAIHARGTSLEPVLLSGIEGGPWRGLVFAPPTSTDAPVSDPPPEPEVSRLAKTVIEGADREGVAITVLRGIEPIELVSLDVRATEVGLFVEHDRSIARAESLRIRAKHAVVADPDLFGSLDLRECTGPSVIHGSLDGSLKLPAGVLFGTVVLTPGATLEADDATLAFLPRGSLFAMGDIFRIATVRGRRSRFVAHDEASRWDGVLLSDGAQGELTDVVFERAGREAPALQIFDPTSVDVSRATFRALEAVAIRTKDCARYADPTRANSAVGAPLCEKDVPLVRRGHFGGVTGIADPARRALAAVDRDSVLIDAVQTADDALTLEVVRRLLRRELPLLRRAYGRRLAIDARVAGGVTFELDVSAAGTVASVKGPIAPATSVDDDGLIVAFRQILLGALFRVRAPANLRLTFALRP